MLDAWRAAGRAALLAATLACHLTWGAESAPRPNLVLIVADDLGYGDLGVYGAAEIRTPTLDRMAREGLRFTQFYAASPLCTPSRAALMTGRLPVRTGLTRVLPPMARRGIKAREITIAELLRSVGYRTACIGKWHLGRLPKFLPTRNGFDRYFGLPYSNDMSRKSNPHHPVYRLKLVPPLPLMRDERIIEREPDQSQLTRRYTDEAIAFIRDSVAEEAPFFLYLPHTAPHTPLHASAPFAGHSPKGPYGDVVNEIDWSTGEILAELRRLGIDANTLVIFTSDNGPWLRLGPQGGSAGPFREGKGSTFEGGVRVPLIARWPGRIREGITTDAFGTMMDLLPTFARLAGAEMPGGRIYDGEDLSSVLLEGAPGREPLMYYWFRRELRAVRQGRWKLHVVINEPSHATRKATRLDQPALYDLLADPGELHDVAAAHPEVVERLLHLMALHQQSLR